MTTTTTMHLLLGVQQTYETDGVALLKHILRRYSVDDDEFSIEYVYSKPPAPTIIGRAPEITIARRRLERAWVDGGPVIGCGWMACELLTGKGKTKLKDVVGTKWKYAPDHSRFVWICNDPAGALFNPNLVVDIAAVIRAAGVEAGMEMKVNQNEPAFDWSRWL